MELLAKARQALFCVTPSASLTISRVEPAAVGTEGRPRKGPASLKAKAAHAQSFVSNDGPPIQRRGDGPSVRGVLLLRRTIRPRPPCRRTRQTLC